MKLPRRMTYCLIGALLLATAAYRYPLDIGHETGSDTTFIHSLANSIVSQRRAVWTLHPTSYFGLYALSYPSAAPFLLASFSQVSGIPIEGVMLLTGLIFGMVGALSAFVAARAARRDDRLALLVALLFSIAPFYVKETTWIGSSRGFETALVPAVFLLLLIRMRKPDVRTLGLTITLIILMSALHRMGMLSLFVLIAFVFTLPFHRITQRLRFALARYEGRFRVAALGASMSAFVGLFYIQFQFPGIAGPNVVEQYGNGAVLTGTSFPILIANMAVSLAGKVGVLLPLVVVGVSRGLWKRPKEDRDKFLLVAAFIIIPLLSLRDYIAEFLTYIFVLFIVIGLFPPHLVKSKRRLGTIAIIAVLVAGSMAFSWSMKDYWRMRYSTDSPVPDELYATAMYVRWQAHGNLASNEGMSAGRVTALADRPVLPIGGASIHWWGVQQLTFGFINGSAVAVQAIPLTSITFQTDEIYTPVGVPNAKDDFESIFYANYGDSAALRTLQGYGIRYIFQINEKPTEFQSYIWRTSPFLSGVHEQAYRVFDSPSYSIWFVG